MESDKDIGDESFPSFLYSSTSDQASQGSLTLSPTTEAPVGAYIMGGNCASSAIRDTEGTCSGNLLTDTIDTHLEQPEHRTEDSAVLGCSGEKHSHSIVYQNEEGKWVTDLAYYTPFENETDHIMPQELNEKLQTEEFLCGSNAINKILDDQEVFDNEHRFIQEEQILANGSPGICDTSWKLPSSGHVLMRTSQISTDFDSGNQSYLRLSLGEFFQQRSEALGCLGNAEDVIKRPSFGYIIQSPEKREPFPLIESSDFSRSCSFQAETTHPIDTDEPLDSQELGGERIPVDILEKKSSFGGSTPINNSNNISTSEIGRVKDFGDTVVLENTRDISETTVLSTPSTSGSSNAQLGITTIASAIINASVNSDPAQLAAMIIELSQRKHRQTSKGTLNENQSWNQTRANATTQENASCDVNISEMQKYLERVGCSTDSEICDSKVWADLFELNDAVDVSHQTVKSPIVDRTETNSQCNPDLTKKSLNSKAFVFPSDTEQNLQDHAQLNANGFTNNPPVTNCALHDVVPCTMKQAIQPKGLEEHHVIGVGNSKIAEDFILARNKESAFNLSRKETSQSLPSLALKTPASPSDELKSFQRRPSLLAYSSFKPSTPLTHSSPNQWSFLSRDGDFGTVPPEDLMPTFKETPVADPMSSSLSRLTYLSMNDTLESKNHDRNSIELGTTIIRASPTPEEDRVSETKDFKKHPQTQFRDDLKPPLSSPVNYTQYTDTTQGNIRSSKEIADLCTFSKHFQPCSKDAPACSHSTSYLLNRVSAPELNQHINIPLLQRDTEHLCNASYPTSAVSITTDLQFPNGIRNILPSLSSHAGPRIDSLHGNYSGSTNVSCSGPHVPLNIAPPDPLSRGGACRNCPFGQCFHIHTDISNHIRGEQGRLWPQLPAAFATECFTSAPVNYPSKYFSKPTHQGFATWTATELSDLGASLVLPHELKFPKPCCVGIGSQIPLRIFNPTDHWLQVCISITNASIDGKEVHLIPYQWIVAKSNTVVSPKSTEDQKVLFIPSQPGVYQCTLRVLSWPASSEQDVSFAKMFSKCVPFVGIAENPLVDVHVEDQSGSIDFGDLPAGSSKSLPLRLINRTHAVVPIRLVMVEKTTGYRCFKLSSSQPSEKDFYSKGDGNASSVFNCILPANNGVTPEIFNILIHCHAPQRDFSSTAELGAADDLAARIDIEVDSPGPSHFIKTIGLKARSGTARVHAPRHFQTLSFQTSYGQKAQQILPLKNAGNINLELQLKTDQSACFSVQPSKLILSPGEEQDIAVSFVANNMTKENTSVLTILVSPSGPQYEVSLKGTISLNCTNEKATTNPSTDLPESNFPAILSNRQFLAWGGVKLGKVKHQTIVLRNNSGRVAQQLRLLIRGQDQDCFQFLKTLGNERSQHQDLRINPLEDKAVHLAFTPSRVATMQAKLEIKQSGMRPSQPGVKFTIPLSGYGGTSDIALEGLEKSSESCVAKLTGIREGEISQLCLYVNNTGSRPAYVSAVLYSDLEKMEPADMSVFSLTPSQFVLKENSTEVITLLLKVSQREHLKCQLGQTLLATLGLFWGDELSRQQYKRFRRSRLFVKQNGAYDDFMIRNISFEEIFLNEDKLAVSTLPQTQSDAQLFFSSMKKVLISVIGTRDALDAINSLNAMHRNESLFDSGSGPSHPQEGHVSLDVLPVRGPPLETKEAPQKIPEGQCDSWSISPDEVILVTPPTVADEDTPQIQITNHVGHKLHFELSWPAHCLSITPQNGVVEPRSDVQIHISPNLSFVSQHLQLPWYGHVYILSGGQQKLVKVQIQQGMAKCQPTPIEASHKSKTPPLPLSTMVTSLQSIASHPSNGLSSSCVSQVEITNSTLVFPVTTSGDSAECFLKVENKGDEVSWDLSSLAPPYVKGVGVDEDVHRATYSVFRCPNISGLLGAQKNMQVPFLFIPLEEGNYAQFWDLVYHPIKEPEQKSHLRFQLCGRGMKSTANLKDDVFLAPKESSEKVKEGTGTTGTHKLQAVTHCGVYAPQDLYVFPDTHLRQAHTLKVNFRNSSYDTHELTFLSPDPPFHIKHSKYSLRSQHYINLPVQFRPTAEGTFKSLLDVQLATGTKLSIRLVGEAIP